MMVVVRMVCGDDSIEIGGEDVVEEASKVSDILSEGFGNRRTDQQTLVKFSSVSLATENVSLNEKEAL